MRVRGERRATRTRPYIHIKKKAFNLTKRSFLPQKSELPLRFQSLPSLRVSYHSSNPNPSLASADLLTSVPRPRSLPSSLTASSSRNLVLASDQTLIPYSVRRSPAIASLTGHSFQLPISPPWTLVILRSFFSFLSYLKKLSCQNLLTDLAIDPFSSWHVIFALEDLRYPTQYTCAFCVHLMSVFIGCFHI